MSTSQFYKQGEDVELSGIVLKLNDSSVLVFDIKKFDLRTGQMSDYGFAIQPLTHRLKQRSYLIGGRYQMPVYRGSLPKELLQPQKISGRADEQNPKLIFKKLVELGKIERLSNMQIVTHVSDLNLSEDESEI